MDNQSFNLEKEYYAVFDVVNKFDDRLIIVKGWSVTLSIAALGSGFQFQHKGLFLVACVSGLGFWILDALMKKFQMRHYARMRRIEVVAADQLAPEKRQNANPQIDWSWDQAKEYFKGEEPKPPRWYREPNVYRNYVFSWIALHVMLPHAISVLAGIVLFSLATNHKLGSMPW